MRFRYFVPASRALICSTVGGISVGTWGEVRQHLGADEDRRKTLGAMSLSRELETSSIGTDVARDARRWDNPLPWRAGFRPGTTASVDGPFAPGQSCDCGTSPVAMMGACAWVEVRKRRFASGDKMPR